MNFCHVQRRRGALAADIADHNSQGVRFAIQIVVIIAADLGCGNRDAGDFQAFDIRRALWQRTQLDATGNFQLMLQALLLGQVLIKESVFNGHRCLLGHGIQNQVIFLVKRGF